ncbi:Predicted nucleic acid-binding protein, contains PIN domain [Glycomyces sambucus]|uniref:Ribonuclease VapC n=1 Tax=Glycomyces sambucus TaxID=380244 RepID=A0A1G9KWJ6_9ACTN|nr:type II toxin-antitoxin system VapC family toxin [Glycomyces sambucus]SDL53827.1 Predicted nucleic acid-binding protein, contains PIN domain [Glycomyces sambucus]
MIIADASVVVPALMSFTVVDLQLRAELDQQEIAAPAHLNLEVMSVLRKLCRRSLLTEERAALALFDLGQLPVERVPTDALEMRVWELRHNVTSYDAAYVALAERTGAELWTRDRKLAEAPGTECVFRVFPAN